MATRKNILILLLTGVLMALSPLGAVVVKENALRNKRLFGIEMPENLQSFYGRHDRINSVSLQEYQAGPYAVTEVVIDMASSPCQLRMYHTELASLQDVQAAAPNTPRGTATIPPGVQKAANKARDKANSADPPVIKDYPITTHAMTIEFRVSTKKELEDFYRTFVSTYTQNNATGATDEADDEASARGLAGTLFQIE
ncbi:hypothetical protein [Cerasicoccus arenae]|uniref:hypothetical protein n=1 Tax=Cerasicoccus arenae TaxID=424488 RepID=UPI0016746C20|nr:hypothetical protein [Cerasicoccus arenae]MBK1856731.1 hypothetical protein [Cerasicoccus arenae]